MSYYQFNNSVYSYYSGVKYSDFLKDSLTNKNERFATTLAQDEYFEKQQATKEALEQLERSGSVDAKLAKEVDVESLKQSLKRAENGEASALDSISNANSNKVSPKNAEIKAEPNVNAPLYQKPFVQVSQNAPLISQEAKEAYNPLEVTNKDSNYSHFVRFKDEASNKEVQVPLTEKNAEALKAHFGSLENAEDLIKGYYYEAAYTMGYLEADSNNDGVLSSNEAVNVKNFVSLLDGKYSSIASIYPNSTLEFQSALAEKIGFVDNIGDMINRSIAKDSNFDMGITLAESFGATKELSLFSFRENSFSMFSYSEFYLSDVFLHLGGANDDFKAEKENGSEIAKIKDFKELQSVINEKFLESLSGDLKENIEKSEVIINNLMER